MKQVAFKRHGFADLVRLSTETVYLEYFHLSGDINIYVPEQKNWKRTFRGRTGYQGEQPLFAYAEIEELIGLYTGEDISIQPNYVEAYLIARIQPRYAYTANDKPYFKGVNVEGLTVQDVKRITSLNFREDFAYYNVDEVSTRLDREDESLLQAMFIDVITMLHEGINKTARDLLLK